MASEIPEGLWAASEQWLQTQGVVPVDRAVRHTATYLSSIFQAGREATYEEVAAEASRRATEERGRWGNYALANNWDVIAQWADDQASGGEEPTP